MKFDKDAVSVWVSRPGAYRHLTPACVHLVHIGGHAALYAGQGEVGGQLEQLPQLLVGEVQVEGGELALQS